MLVFPGVNVNRHAVARIGDDLQDGIGSHGLCGRDTNLEPLTRRDLQPFIVGLIAGSASLDCIAGGHPGSPVLQSYSAAIARRPVGRGMAEPKTFSES